MICQSIPEIGETLGQSIQASEDRLSDAEASRTKEVTPEVPTGGSRAVSSR